VSATLAVPVTVLEPCGPSPPGAGWLAVAGDSPSVADGDGACTKGDGAGSAATDQSDQLAIAATLSAEIITVITIFCTRDCAFTFRLPPPRCATTGGTLWREHADQDLLVGQNAGPIGIARVRGSDEGLRRGEDDRTRGLVDRQILSGWRAT
jgi:hypothetical protein